MQSGSKNQKPKLTFERATNIGALHSFSCGQEDVDHIIREVLPDTLFDNELYLVKDGEEVVALFCLQIENHCLFLSDDTKGKMQAGTKPKPNSALVEGEKFWERFNYDSRELTLLAVKEDRRFQHIGSFIIESILERLANDPNENREFIHVRALNTEEYSAIPFYRKCGFFPAVKEEKGVNLMMYRIIPQGIH